MCNFIHSVGFLRFFKNGFSEVRFVKIESDSSNYLDTVFTFVNHNKKYHDCFVFEPITLSPITFNLTVKNKGRVSDYNSDRFFTKYNDMLNFYLETNLKNIVTMPFARILFYKAGKLGDFIRLHGNELPQQFINRKDVNNTIFKDIDNNSYSQNIFDAIKNGCSEKEFQVI